MVDALKLMLYDLLIEESIRINSEAKVESFRKPVYLSRLKQQVNQYHESLPLSTTRAMRLTEPLLGRVASQKLFPQEYQVLRTACGCGAHQLVPHCNPLLKPSNETNTETTTDPLVYCWLDSFNHRGTFASFQRHLGGKSSTALPPASIPLPVHLQSQLFRCSSEWLMRLLVAAPRVRSQLISSIVFQDGTTKDIDDLRAPASLVSLILTVSVYLAKVLITIRRIASQPSLPHDMRVGVLGALPALVSRVTTRIPSQLQQVWTKTLQKHLRRNPIHGRSFHTFKLFISMGSAF
jgi:hypothetical protein